MLDIESFDAITRPHICFQNLQIYHIEQVFLLLVRDVHLSRPLAFHHHLSIQVASENPNLQTNVA